MYRDERPYEKCEQYGAENLTDGELLAVLLRTGTKGANSLELAQKLLHPDFSECGILNIHRWTREDLLRVKGIGKKADAKDGFLTIELKKGDKIELNK